MRDAACDLCQTRLGAMEFNMNRFVILGIIVLGTVTATPAAAQSDEIYLEITQPGLRRVVTV